jgi:hypothetical protein
MLNQNADGLTWRLKVLVAKALGGVNASVVPGPVPSAGLKDVGVGAIMAEIPEGERRDRILDTFRRYAGGASVKAIEKDTGRPRSTISTDLHAVQALIGKPFMRAQQPGSVKDAIAKVTRAKRAHGQRAASVRDWHALRTTFVTLALSAGVPMELVRRVTGHTTVDIVLRHYFRPDREHFKAVLGRTLPDVLTGEKSERMKASEELAALVEKLVAGTATDGDRGQIRKLAATV